MSLQPNDWQEKDPGLFEFELPHAQEVEYDPYSMDILIDTMRPVIEEARIGVGYGSEWSHSNRQEYISGNPPAIDTPKKIVFGAISLFDQSTEFDDIESFIEDLADRTNVDEVALLNDVQIYSSHRDRMEEYATKTTEAFEAEIGGDIDKSYILAKFLASHPGKTNKDYHYVLGQDFLILGAEFDAPDLGAVLKSGLEEGLFDTHIAKDLLYGSLRDSMEGKDNPASSALIKLLELGKFLHKTDNYHEVIDVLSGQEGLDLWLPESRKKFDQYKEDLVKGIVSRHEIRRAMACSLGVIVKPIKEGDFRDYCSLLPALQKGRVRSDGRKTRVEEVQSNMRRKRPKTTKKIGSVASNSVSTTKEIEKPKERPLNFVNIYGEVFPEDSKAFKDMIGDYVQAHPEDIDAFKNDIKKSLDYLRDPVKTNGYARGIQPLKSRNAVFIMADGKKKKIQRFRPSMGTGVSLACKLSHTTRIVFVEHEGAINIMGIADKDDISKVLQKFGVNSKDKKG